MFECWWCGDGSVVVRWCGGVVSDKKLAIKVICIYIYIYIYNTIKFD